MTWIVLLTGIIIVLMSLFGAVMPASFVGILSIWRGPTRFGSAVIARLVLGIVFIFAAPDCRFPTLVRVVGIIALVAAVLIVIIGPQRRDRFVLWFLVRPHSLIRAWCLLGFGFGVLMFFAGA